MTFTPMLLAAIAAQTAPQPPKVFVPYSVRFTLADRKRRFSNAEQPLRSPGGPASSALATDDYRIALQVTPAGDGRAFRLAFRIEEKAGAAWRVVSTPRLEMTVDQDARIEVTLADDRVLTLGARVSTGAPAG